MLKIYNGVTEEVLYTAEGEVKKILPVRARITDINTEIVVHLDN